MEAHRAPHAHSEFVPIDKSTGVADEDPAKDPPGTSVREPDRIHDRDLGLHPDKQRARAKA